MKASFDGARKNLARAFNEYVESESKDPREEALRSLRDIRNSIVALLCMYDESDPDDGRCLINEVQLREVGECDV